MCGSGASAGAVIPDCCHCNDKGTSRRCSCAKAGRTCVSCLPLRRGHCENRDSNPAAVRIAPPSLDPRRSASDTLPANRPFSCSPVTPRSLPVGLDHVPSDHVSPVALVPESLPVALPPAVPTEVPDFHWGQHDAGSF